MKPIFNRGPTLESRLFIVVVLSLGLLISDGLYGVFKPLRSLLTTLVSPVQYIASLPAVFLDASTDRIISQEQLITENEALIQQLVILQADNQRYQSLQAENEQLRKLLDAPIQTNLPKKVAELMAVDNNPYSLQVLINKGSINGVFNTQPVMMTKVSWAKLSMLHKRPLAYYWFLIYRMPFLCVSYVIIYALSQTAVVN